ncbi:MAG: 6,7-dimethyl-8-ribityllumazine synthase [Bacteroidales bacterium]|nr:6,7-dimethyl-8-ribityllumazine synthase [Bacteroidales bacterium]
MGTKDLSSYDPSKIPAADNMKFGIVVSDWNNDITWKLMEGALNTLKKHGASDDNIFIGHVPGSFELPLAAQLLKESRDVDALICLGCVIQGETPHFTYVCQGVTEGITHLNLKYSTPFIFGVLTTDTLQQAADRAGGKHGNKGDEAALTAIRMVDLQRNIKQKTKS